MENFDEIALSAEATNSSAFRANIFRRGIQRYCPAFLIAPYGRVQTRNSGGSVFDGYVPYGALVFLLFNIIYIMRNKMNLSVRENNEAMIQRSLRIATHTED